MLQQNGCLHVTNPATCKGSHHKSWLNSYIISKIAKRKHVEQYCQKLRKPNNRNPWLKYIAIWLSVHCLQRIHLVIFAHTVYIVTIKHKKFPNTGLRLHHALWWNQGFSYTGRHQLPAQVWSAQCLQCTVHPNLAMTISVISVILTSLLSNNVRHIINKIRVILYFIQNRDIHSRTLNWRFLVCCFTKGCDFCCRQCTDNHTAMCLTQRFVLLLFANFLTTFAVDS